jgi:hypothetical protein
MPCRTSLAQASYRSQDPDPTPCAHGPGISAARRSLANRVTSRMALADSKIFTVGQLPEQEGHYFYWQTLAGKGRTCFVRALSDRPEYGTQTRERSGQSVNRPYLSRTLLIS